MVSTQRTTSNFRENSCIHQILPILRRIINGVKKRDWPCVELKSSWRKEGSIEFFSFCQWIKINQRLRRFSLQTRISPSPDWLRYSGFYTSWVTPAALNLEPWTTKGPKFDEGKTPSITLKILLFLLVIVALYFLRTIFFNFCTISAASSYDTIFI